MEHRAYPSLLGLIALLGACESAKPLLTINEIFYHPPSECEEEEFIELYHAGNEALDLSRWKLTGAVYFEFPSGTMVSPGDHIVVARDPEALRTLFGRIPRLFGPWGAMPNGNDNGAWLSNREEEIVLTNEAGVVVDRVHYGSEAPWPISPDGEGPSLELMSPDVPNDVAGHWRAARRAKDPTSGEGEPISATPGWENSQRRRRLPPDIHFVEHEPKAPRSTEPVEIRAGLRHPDGMTPVSSVRLEYQVVAAGEYIRITDAEYLRNWRSVAMQPSGQDGSKWTVTLPAQPHRSLVRYRVTATDAQGETTRLPYEDDPSPNFAYFVYDGVPDYVADQKSAHGSVPFRHPASGLIKVPVYHLITASEDLRNCWYDRIPPRDWEGRRAFRWRGTFVAGDEVYDHITYRVRGGVFRYAYPKRYMKVRFLRGHYFQGVDNLSKPYPQKRRTLNLNSAIANPIAKAKVRGESGMNETLAFALFRWAGVPASQTTWVHFRIIQHEDEEGRDQFSGDFYGLYLDVEQVDRRFLRAHGRSARGNLYKIDRDSPNGRWTKEVNGCNPPDDSDIVQFVDHYTFSEPDKAWWKDHLDLQQYFSYRAVVDVARHYDISDGKNYYYYRNPETGLWETFPWDVDMTFNTREGAGREPFHRRVIDRFPLTYGIRYKNRLRELLDLLFRGEKLFPVIDRWQKRVDDLARADRDRWDAGEYASLSQRVEELKDWIRYRILFAEQLAGDVPRPDKPVILFPPPQSVLPPDALFFVSSKFRGGPDRVHRSTRWIATRIHRFSPLEDQDFHFLIPPSAAWRYHRGRTKPSRPPLQWTRIDYDDSGWQEGQAGFGYGDGEHATILRDMRHSYSTVFIRKRFAIDDPGLYHRLELRVDYDDGFVAYLNGKVVLRVNAPEGVSLHALAPTPHERHGGETFVLEEPGLSQLVRGANVLAIQVFNDALGSSDLTLNASLKGILASNELETDEASLEELLSENELAPDWDSGSKRKRLRTIRIRPDAMDTTVGNLYRIRVRHEDQDRSWSAWSEPVEIRIGKREATHRARERRATR